MLAAVAPAVQPFHIIVNSITPMIAHFENITSLDPKKYPCNQLDDIRKHLSKLSEKIRVVTYNILFNLKDHELEPQYRWNQRLPRVVTAILEMNPDILCCQEIYGNQMKDMIREIGREYDYWSMPAQDGEQNAIFYRKNRFTVIKTDSWQMTYTSPPQASNVQAAQSSQVPEKPKIGPKQLVMAHFQDNQTKKEFVVINTHLSWFDPDERESQVLFIAKKIQHFSKLPVIFTGDLNTMPQMLDLLLPFNDGDYIHGILTEKGGIRDAREKSLLGHLGPFSTFTNLPGQNHRFQGNGTPGVFLDRVYVTNKVKVLIHAVQPILVDGLFPSDHQPVMVDILLPDPPAKH